METGWETNRITLRGVAAGECQFNHRSYGESFYLFPLEVERKSGYRDRLNVMVSDRIIPEEGIVQGQMIHVTGQIRTYNEVTPVKNKLNIVVFCRDIFVGEPKEENISDSDFVPIYDGQKTRGHENYVVLDGFICKPPLLRTSPLGRELCDIMLAVNRMYGKSDYIPCIAWGRNARFTSNLSVGTRITIEGRMQSRQYRKTESDGSISVRTAFEVSILKLTQENPGG